MQSIVEFRTISEQNVAGAGQCGRLHEQQGSMSERMSDGKQFRVSIRGIQLFNPSMSTQRIRSTLVFVRISGRTCRPAGRRLL